MVASEAVQLDIDLRDLIGVKVAQYGYASPSSYVRDLIRRDEARVEWLREELQKGIDSGMSPLSVDEIFDEVYAEIDRVCASKSAN